MLYGRPRRVGNLAGHALGQPAIRLQRQGDAELRAGGAALHQCHVAALHWLGGHDTLFPRLLSLLSKGGVLAVQMPGMHAAPLRALQHEVAASGPWAAALADVGFARPILEPGAYWDLLRPRCTALDMWETTYMHALQGDNAAVQWAIGTSLKPFLDRLTPELREGYLAAYSKAMAGPYPRRADGSTLLPFRRVFMVATV